MSWVGLELLGMSRASRAVLSMDEVADSHTVNIVADSGWHCCDSGGDVVQQVLRCSDCSFTACANCHLSLARDPREEGSWM